MTGSVIRQTECKAGATAMEPCIHFVLSNRYLDRIGAHSVSTHSVSAVPENQSRIN